MKLKTAKTVNKTIDVLTVLALLATFLDLFTTFTGDLGLSEITLNWLKWAGLAVTGIINLLRPKTQVVEQVVEETTITQTKELE